MEYVIDSNTLLDLLQLQGIVVSTCSHWKKIVARMVSLYDYLKGTQEKEVVLGVFNRNNNNSGPDKNKSGGQSHRCRFQCAKCGKRGHTIERCYHRYSRCDICGRQDHLKYLCKNERKEKEVLSWK